MSQNLSRGFRGRRDCLKPRRYLPAIRDNVFALRHNVRRNLFPDCGASSIVAAAASAAPAMNPYAFFLLNTDFPPAAVLCTADHKMHRARFLLQRRQGGGYYAAWEIRLKNDVTLRLKASGCSMFDRWEADGRMANCDPTICS